MSAEPALGELIADQRRLPALFDQNRTPISLFTLDGVCVAANHAAAGFFAPETGDLTGTPLEEWLGDEHRRHAARYLERVALGEDFAVLATMRAGNRELSMQIEFAPAVFEERVVGAYVSWRETGEDAAARREIERRLQEVTSLFEHSIDSMLAIDLGGRVTAANPAALDMFGYERDELIGRHYRSLVDSDWYPQAAALFERARTGRAFDDMTVGRRKDGTRIDVEGTATPIVVDGAVVGIYVVGRDVTARRRVEAGVREQAERIAELYQVVASTGRSDDEQIQRALELGIRRLRCDGAYLTHVKNGSVTYRYVAGEGVPAAGTVRPLAGSFHHALLTADDALAVDDAPLHEREGRAFIGAPVMLEGAPYGTVAFVANAPRGEAFAAADRDFVRLIGALAATAIERGEQRRRLDTLAYFDALTGLPNRTLLAERLEETIALAKRAGRSFALHFLDLDGFKAVNDTYGHPHGDHVLRAVAQRLSQAVRKSDFVARLGGDEFVVVQPEIARAGEALEIAGRLRELIGDPIRIGTHEHRLGCSIGIALYPHDGLDAPTMLARADAALYAVKAHGRNGVAFASVKNGA